MTRSPALRRSLVLAAGLGAALALPASASAERWIEITSDGFDPPTVTVDTGEAVHFTNRSGHVQTVTAGDGAFASGEIPNRGGYSLALSVPGAHDYTSTPGAFAGQVRVRLTSLEGPSFEPANDHIPDPAFPPDEHGDFAVDPSTAIHSFAIAADRRLHAARDRGRGERCARGCRRKHPRRDSGFPCRAPANGHYALTLPNRQRVTLSGTPTNPGGGARAARAEIERKLKEVILLKKLALAIGAVPVGVLILVAEASARSSWSGLV